MTLENNKTKHLIKHLHKCNLTASLSFCIQLQSSSFQNIWTPNLINTWRWTLPNGMTHNSKSIYVYRAVATSQKTVANRLNRGHNLPLPLLEKG